MIWSREEVYAACRACPTTFRLTDVQDATEVVYGAKIPYPLLKNHIYNLIEDDNLFRIKHGVFALSENDKKVLRPEAIEQLQELKVNLDESSTRVENAELQLSIARASKVIAESAFIEAYQKIASERMADVNEALGGGIEVIVLPAT